MNKSALENFDKAAQPVDEKSAFRIHFRILKDKMRELAGTLSGDDSDPAYLNPIEEELKQAFRTFLTSMNYPMALGNFDILLKEKSEENFLREDGSVNWLHEFLPIFELMTMASQGKQNHGFDITDLEEHGRLEMLITTHLRHDSKEDFKNIDDIESEQKEILAALLRPHSKYQISINNPFFTDMLLNNIDVISQRRTNDGTPKGLKEDSIVYLARIVTGDKSNPIILLCKMADIGHNLATLLGAEKFTPEKRLKICNGREDMFGPRQGFTEEAIERWPSFKSAIQSLDCSMGVVLYPHFRYLTNVDLHYKAPTSGRVGIEKYLKPALGLDILEPFNKIHIGFKRMATSVPKDDTERYQRLQVFMHDVIKPALHKQSKKFPYLFADNDNNQAHYGARALPNNATHAPII